MQKDSFIRLVQKFIRLFQNILQKNPNEVWANQLFEDLREYHPEREQLGWCQGSDLGGSHSRLPQGGMGRTG